MTIKIKLWDALDQVIQKSIINKPLNKQDYRILSLVRDELGHKDVVLI